LAGLGVLRDDIIMTTGDRKLVQTLVERLVTKLPHRTGADIEAICEDTLVLLTRDTLVEYGRTSIVDVIDALLPLLDDLRKVIPFLVLRGPPLIDGSSRELPGIIKTIYEDPKCIWLDCLRLVARQAGKMLEMEHKLLEITLERDQSTQSQNTLNQTWTRYRFSPMLQP
jgi:hypothetical protein